MFALSRTCSVAGIGPVSIRMGSTPTTSVWTIRAIGSQPCSSAASSLVINSAAEPSTIPDELPAWMTPSLRRETPAAVSRASRGRFRDGDVRLHRPRSNRPSSSVSTGTSWLSKRPSSAARFHRSCDSTAISSSSRRSNPTSRRRVRHFRPGGPSRRSARSRCRSCRLRPFPASVTGHRNACHVLSAAGHDDVVKVGTDVGCGEIHGLLTRPTHPIELKSRDVVSPSRDHGSDASDVRPLFEHGLDTPRTLRPRSRTGRSRSVPVVRSTGPLRGLADGYLETIRRVFRTVS